MNHKQQIQHFSTDLEAMIDRYRSEYDIPYASIIGCLEIQKWALAEEAMEDEET